MFQDGSGGGPTDSPLTRSASCFSADPSTRSERTASSASPVERRQSADGRWDAANPRSRNSRPGRAITLPPKRKSPSRLACDRPKTGRGTLPEESALAEDSRTPGGSLQIPIPTSAVWKRQVEFPGSTLRIHPFTSKQFHVLLNSLFKVLFNFPSRYLSAIGLVSDLLINIRNTRVVNYLLHRFHVCLLK